MVFNEYLIIHCFAGGQGPAGAKGIPGSPGSAGLPGYPVRFHGLEALVSIWKIAHSGNTVTPTKVTSLVPGKEYLILEYLIGMQLSE